MLDSVEEHLANGEDLTEALISSGRRRFRPVLMTSLTAILGMLPLAVAIAVICGLVFALVLSLVVTPTIYALLQNSNHPQNRDAGSV